WRARAELAHALLAAGDRDGARSAANGATELVEQLALHVPDGRLRQDFLERAMEHLPGRLRRRGDATAAEGLTSREAEIAAWVARGLTNREIAEELVLSSRTVETHVANAMAKLGFGTRSQLAAWAVEHGLLADNP